MSSKNQELYYKPQNLFTEYKINLKKNKQIKIGIVKNNFGSTIYFICSF